MADELKWIIPTGDGLTAVISSLVHFKSNQNTGEDFPPDRTAVPATIDLEQPNRAKTLVQTVVRELRGIMEAVGKSPVSVLVDSVPPEALRHVENIAAWQLVCSQPTLQYAVMADKAVFAPFEQRLKAAEAYFEKLRTGWAVTPPTEPCGVDYLTAVSADNPAVKGIFWSDNDKTDDENATGQKTIQDGFVVDVPSDPMETF